LNVRSHPHPPDRGSSSAPAGRQSGERCFRLAGSPARRSAGGCAGPRSAPGSDWGLTWVLDPI
jgi:hypothetical protein